MVISLAAAATCRTRQLIRWVQWQAEAAVPALRLILVFVTKAMLVKGSTQYSHI
jgi:hypothetical protein